MTRYAMAIDLSRCVGCAACMVACKAENQLPEGVFRLRVGEMTWGEPPTIVTETLHAQCYHCEGAPCTAVCPTGALVNKPITAPLAPRRSLKHPEAPQHHDAQHLSRRVEPAARTADHSWHSHTSGQLSSPTGWPHRAQQLSRRPDSDGSSRYAAAWSSSSMSISKCAVGTMAIVLPSPVRSAT